MIIVICITCAISAFLGYFLYKENKKSKETILINHKREQYNQQLEQNILQLENNIAQLEIRQNEIDSRFEAKTVALNRLTSSIDAASREYESIARKRAEDEYKDKFASLEKEYQARVEEIENDTRNKLLDFKMISSKVQDLENKQLAYIRMKQREEEMSKKQDYYRLILSKEDKLDIELLREVQIRLKHKETIDKIIWSVYYKPAYDILMSHLFTGTEKICGIYKITCINNEKIYIGQGTDIKERFKQHIKNAISSYSSSTNKLYQEMKKFDVENFTFEILEQLDRNQLNERESYWINFYQSVAYGLNTQKGNKGVYYENYST